MNNKIRQSGNTNQIMFNINEQIAYLSNFVTLNPGDLLLTGIFTISFYLSFENKGTPDGIDSFESGDILEAKMTDPKSNLLSTLKVKVNYEIFDPLKIQ